MTRIDQLDDLQLAQMARTEPATAIRILNRLYKRVYRVVYMIVGKNSDVDEFVQMCLMEILEHLHKFRGDGTLESWAGQVAYRVTMRELKKRQRVQQKQEAMVLEDIPNLNTPERMMRRQELWEQLNEALQKIPLKRRTALLMHIVYDYTVPEVAEITGVSVNTVKDHLKIAYRELRTVFAQNTSIREMMLEEIND
ncbi:MAG: sigma-70 family RNA polymerase sigma factor [Myxococcota bacterium]|nr:sigma-70 family RNA polymerase sigma factor [Myxococcota bacterium]